MDLCGEPGGQESLVGVQSPGPGAVGRAEPAKPYPFLKVHQADIPHTTPSLLSNGAQWGLGLLYTPTTFQPTGEAPSPREGTILWGRQAPAWPTASKGPSLHQLCLAASTHKALMFSVTTEVYCGSVCGETKYPP